MQPRVGVLEHGGELGGEPGLRAVGIADRENQRFGILSQIREPHTVAIGQDHRQRGKKQHLPAVAFDELEHARGACRWRRWDFSAHGSHPGRVGFTGLYWLGGPPGEIANI